MATDFKSIPIIDVSALVAKCDDPKRYQDPDISEVVKLLDRTCREAGFFYVKGHGIPEDLMEDVKNVAHKFFSLPLEEKLKIKMTAATGFRGYERLGEERTKGLPDMHEAVNCFKEFEKGAYGALGKPVEACNVWPVEPQNFKPLMEEYIRRCTDLSRKIMRGIALALGGSPEEFEGDRAGDPFWGFRVIGYPGQSASNGHNYPKDSIGTGDHTDYGLLTLVNQENNIRALEVQNFSGEWISAIPIPGTFVCNIGDMLQIYSNGLYKSTVHRVINNNVNYRASIIYFYETNFDTKVEPLEICVKKTGGAKQFGKAVYGAHLVGKLTKIY